MPRFLRIQEGRLQTGFHWEGIEKPQAHRKQYTVRSFVHSLTEWGNGNYIFVQCFFWSWRPPVPDLRPQTNTVLKHFAPKSVPKEWQTNQVLILEREILLGRKLNFDKHLIIFYIRKTKRLLDRSKPNETISSRTDCFSWLLKSCKVWLGLYNVANVTLGVTLV